MYNIYKFLKLYAVMNACRYFDMKLTLLEIWADTHFHISAFPSKRGQIYVTANSYVTFPASKSGYTVRQITEQAT
jgi:hypothetical protein